MRTCQSQSIESLGASPLLEHHAKLGNLSLLLWRNMARVAAQCRLGDSWEVVLVVLWVELERGNVRHFDVVCDKGNMCEGCV